MLNVGSVVTRPQWNPTQVDSFQPNEKIKISKSYTFQKGSILGGSVGYDRRDGIGAGVFGTKNIGDTSLSASLFKTQNAGTNVGLGINQKIGERTSVFGNHERNNMFGYRSNSFGASHKFQNGLEIFGSRQTDNFGGRTNTFGLVKPIGNNGALSITGGQQNGNSFGNIGYKHTFGKK